MLRQEPLHPHDKERDNKQIRGGGGEGVSGCAVHSGFPAFALLFILCLKFSVSAIVAFSNQNSVIGSQWVEFSCRLVFNNVTTWRHSTKLGIATLDFIPPRVWHNFLL